MSTLVVTGGSRGIGAAVCVAAAAQGWDVVVDYTLGAAAAEEVVERITSGGGHALAVQGDVRDADAVERLFAAADAWRGPVTGLVNNAGVSGGLSRVDEVTPEALRTSTLHGGSGGAIVNVSSRAAVLGGPGEYVHYAASKAALDALTVGLAREVATEGVRVNGVAVGLVDTDFHASAGEPGRPDRIRPTVPMQRSGAPEEIAAAIVWLLSDAASYTTGTVVAVSGGR